MSNDRQERIGAGPTAGRGRLGIVVSAAALCAAFLAGDAAADWLVMRDGARLETRGPWKVKGEQIVFTATNGRLSSLVAADVDLAASEELTAAAKRQSERPAEPEPKAKSRAGGPVWVLTEKDLPPQRRRPAAGEAGDEAPPAAGSGEDGGSGGDAPRRLAVRDWRIIEDDDPTSVSLSGRIENPTADAVSAIRLTVRLIDGQGEEISRRYANVGSGALVPGATTPWEVTFPDVIDFEAVQFETFGIPFRAAAEEAPDSDSTAD